MKFGLSFLPDIQPGQMDPLRYYENALELCRRADQGGLHTIKMTEHYLHPYGGYCPSPLIFLAAVAAATAKIRLITGCVLPAFHHPVKLAGWTAMVDAISKGRLDVGFARAYLPYEFETFDVPMDQSRDRYMATIETVIRLWTEEKLTTDSPFFTCKDASSLPRPTQLGHPPVWGAATRSRESFSWIGEKGFGLLATNTITAREQLAEYMAIYRDSFIPSPLSPLKESRIALSIPLLIHDNAGKAGALGTKYFSDYFAVWSDACTSWNNKSSVDYPGYTGLQHALAHLSVPMMMGTKAVCFSDSQGTIDTIHQLKEWYGIDEILWQIDFGAMPLEHSLQTLDLLIEKVMPAFRSVPQG